MVTATWVRARIHGARGALRRWGRVPVSPSGLDADVVRDEEVRRRPVDKEVRRLRTTALWLLVGCLFITLALLFGAFAVTHGPVDMALLSGSVAWVREQREEWEGALLLGIPVTVLIPSVFVVAFASTGPENSGEGWIQREATLEILSDVLWSGLMLGIVLAYLAAIPSKAHVDLGGTLLAVGIAVGCALIASTLRVHGTRRDLLVAHASDRCSDLTRRADSLMNALHQHRIARWMSKPGLRYQLVVLVVGLVAVVCPLGLVAVWSLVTTGPRPPTTMGSFVGSALAILAFTGGQALFLMYALSRRRLALPRSDRLAVAGFAAVPLLVLLIFIAAAALAGSTESRTGALLMLGFLLTSDVVAVLLNKTLLGSVLDYRRLQALEGYARNQLAYLGAPRQAETVAEIHQRPEEQRGP